MKGGAFLKILTIRSAQINNLLDAMDRNQNVIEGSLGYGTLVAFEAYFKSAIWAK